jgi:hypothetical protein
VIDYKIPYFIIKLEIKTKYLACINITQGGKNRMKKHYVRRGLTVGVICLLMLTSIPMVSSDNTTSPQSNTDGLIDNVEINCLNPYLIMILLREWAFTVEFINHNDEHIDIEVYMNVTDKDGNLIDVSPVVNPSFGMGAHSAGNFQFTSFATFRKAHHLFGLFYVNVDFHVLDDNSSRREQFPGFIFAISTIILNREGVIIE